LHNVSVHIAVASPVAGRAVSLETDPDIVAGYLEDAAHYPGGHAAALARPSCLAEVVWVVQHAARVLPVGARSSLTGGATPAGDIVLSTERLTTMRIAGEHVIAGAGVPLRQLQHALSAHGLWFPPVPTFMGATVGGAIATNAAGAATFKYGAVRRWVNALTVVLADGSVLTVRRGEVHAGAGAFIIGSPAGERHVNVPRIRMPDVPKCSAGYFAAPQMDLIDLFIGCEGTLGVVVEAELAVRRRPAGVCWVFLALDSEDDAIALTQELRAAPALDVAAIEHIDRRSIEVLREDGVDRRLGVRIPDSADVVLLVQIEVDAAQAEEGVGDAVLEQLAGTLQTHDALDGAEAVLPSDARRAAAFVELREAVPAGVNRRVAQAHAADARVHKTAADMIVPFASFARMMKICRALAAERQLDLAVWGHISDGNVHPNVIPRDYRDVERGRAMMLALARDVIAMGGSPLAEHGVGRNPVKQRLLAMLYGAEGVDDMRAVKLSLDPAWKLAPGLLFEGGPPCHAG
jgi:D-lactate dehydrogenase (cytochrome)